VQTGAGAVLNTFKVHAGSSLVVFGTGGVGLSAIMAARVAGSTVIIAVDINPERLEVSEYFALVMRSFSPYVVRS